MEKHYTNGEITVNWLPEKCIHSTKCWRGLAEVFNPRAKPWINMDGAATDKIAAQVDTCPSGALSYILNSTQQAEPAEKVESTTKVEALKNGPLLVYGTITVHDKTGVTTKTSNTTAFCRCGASANKPYCDGSHIKVAFRDE
jgi:uncharacterized Fe-S cluster protein YjdI